MKTAKKTAVRRCTEDGWAAYGVWATAQDEADLAYGRYVIAQDEANAAWAAYEAADDGSKEACRASK